MINIPDEVFFVITPIATGWALAWIPKDGVEIMSSRRKACAALHICIGLTFFLWAPWAWYGLTSLYEWNVGKINDFSRPVEVDPPTIKTRPSAADRAEAQ